VPSARSVSTSSVRMGMGVGYENGRHRCWAQEQQAQILSTRVINTRSDTVSMSADVGCENSEHRC